MQMTSKAQLKAVAQLAVESLANRVHSNGVVANTSIDTHEYLSVQFSVPIGSTIMEGATENNLVHTIQHDIASNINNKPGTLYFADMPTLTGELSVVVAYKGISLRACCQYDMKIKSDIVVLDVIPIYTGIAKMGS